MSLARLASRGAVVNVGFGAAVQVLLGIQGVIVPRLLGPEDMGLYAVAFGGVAVGMTLKELGIPKKLVQEREVDLHTSYAVAFTLEVLLAASFFLVVLGVAPLLAWAYGRPELWLLTSVLSFQLFSTAFLDLPASLPYRELDFVRRNGLLAVGPVATFVVTVPTALLGWGVWALVAGAAAGFVAASLVLLLAGPVRPRLAWDRALVRRYVRFGWPLWVAAVLGTAAGWGGVFAISSVIGLAGLGYFQVAQGWASRAVHVDHLLSDTIFPALCSIQGSTERMWRAFVVTNRLSMLWAAPVGLGLFLFAQPLVALLLGPAWSPAVLLVQAQGLGVVVTSIGFNWHVFFAARGETRPQLVVSVLGAAWIVLVVVPLLLLFAIPGAAAAVVVLAIGTNVVRQRYLRRLFDRFSLTGLVWREIGVALAAAAVIGGLRLAGWEVHDLPGLLAQGLVFGALCAVLALAVDRRLLADAVAALRERPPADDDVLDVRLRTWSPPRRMAFPLGITADGDGAWATTRDWPALGRFDGVDWRWTPLPRTKELLVTALHDGHVWAVDAGRRRLWRVEPSTGRAEAADLPLRRPDAVVAGPDGRLWVGDTHSPALAAVEPGTLAVTAVVGPHPTRAIVPTADGLWLASSTLPVLTLLSTGGDVLGRVDLPGVPFGLTPLSGDRLVAILKDDDLLVVVDPLTGTIEAIDLPAASGPTQAAVVGDRLLVALSAASEVRELPLPVPVVYEPATSA